jgi:NADPH:quinone reductase
VIATVSGDEKAQIARAAGAHAVINYRAGDTAAAIVDVADGPRVDRIVEVEFGGNLAVSETVLAPGGVSSRSAMLAASSCFQTP